MYNRALALKEAKKFEDALAVALKLVEVNGEEADYHSLASGVYLQMKNLPKASEHAERAETLKKAKVEGAEGAEAVAP